MNFADVQDELGLRLAGISGLRVSVFEPASITGPTAIFAFPNSISFDETVDGMWRASLRLAVALPNPTTKQARDLAAAYCADEGDKSIKVALETDGDEPPVSFSTVNVDEIVFDGVTIGETPYAAAIMTIRVTGG